MAADIVCRERLELRELVLERGHRHRAEGLGGGRGWVSVDVSVQQKKGGSVEDEDGNEEAVEQGDVEGGRDTLDYSEKAKRRIR